MHFATQGQEDGAFLLALNKLAQCLGAALAPKTTPISIFNARCSDILKDADQGTLHVISHGSKRYALLTENQLVEFMNAGLGSKSRSLADTLASLSPPKQSLASSLLMLAGSAHDAFTLPDDAS